MTDHNDIHALIDSWTATQQKLWNDWLQTLGKGGGGGTLATTWKQGLAQWREAVMQTLDTQAKAMTSWAAQAEAATAGNPQAKQWADGGVKLLEQWTTAQRALWEQWFAMMEKATEGVGAVPGTEQMQQWMGAWQQAAKQIQAMQKDWAAALKPGGR